MSSTNPGRQSPDLEDQSSAQGREPISKGTVGGSADGQSQKVHGKTEGQDEQRQKTQAEGAEVSARFLYGWCWLMLKLQKLGSNPGGALDEHARGIVD